MNNTRKKKKEREYTYEVNYIIYSRKREDHTLRDFVQLGIRIRKDLDFNLQVINLYDKYNIYNMCVYKRKEAIIKN